MRLHPPLVRKQPTSHRSHADSNHAAYRPPIHPASLAWLASHRRICQSLQTGNSSRQISVSIHTHTPKASTLTPIRTSTSTTRWIHPSSCLCAALTSEWYLYVFAFAVRRRSTARRVAPAGPRRHQRWLHLCQFVQPCCCSRRHSIQYTEYLPFIIIDGIIYSIQYICHLLP